MFVSFSVRIIPVPVVIKLPALTGIVEMMNHSSLTDSTLKNNDVINHTYRNALCNVSSRNSLLIPSFRF